MGFHRRPTKSNGGKHHRKEETAVALSLTEHINSFITIARNNQYGIYKLMKFTRPLWILIIFISCSWFAQADSAFFPKQQLSFGFYDNNVIKSNPWRPPSPLFWDSALEVQSGGTAVYTRMLYHTQKYFSVEWGVAASVWTKSPQSIGALSALLQLRWWIFRTQHFNPYVVYSVAGPTLLTREHLDTAKFTAPFIFQDYLGCGILFGKQHHFDLSARMYHYSNGDLFEHNSGFDVPLVVFFGFDF